MMPAEEHKNSRCRQAEFCLQSRDFQAAIGIYRQLVADYPEEDSLLLALAWAYYDAGSRNEAIECFEKLFERELSRKVFTGFAYDELVRIYKVGRQWPQLVDVCAKAVAVQPEDTALLSELAAAFTQAGRVREAKKACRRALALEPEGTSLHCLLGDAHLAAGEFNLAERAYRRAARSDPEATGALLSRLATGYAHRGEHRREEKVLRRCLKINPLEPLLYCRLGDCLINQGRAAYEKAIALSPGSEAAFRHRWENSLTALLPQTRPIF